MRKQQTVCGQIHQIRLSNISNKWNLSLMWLKNYVERIEPNYTFEFKQKQFFVDTKQNQTRVSVPHLAINNDKFDNFCAKINTNQSALLTESFCDWNGKGWNFTPRLLMLGCNLKHQAQFSFLLLCKQPLFGKEISKDAIFR